MSMHFRQFALSIPAFSYGVLALAVVATAASCATPGAEPNDMSTEEHAAAAAREDGVAAEHQAQFDPAADVAQTRCRAAVGASAQLGNEGACWTSMTNPTAAHQRTAAQHRRHAADHREASTALKEAEARACTGLSDDDRDASPFEHAEDIASVAPLTEQVSVGKTSHAKGVGAVVTFRSVPGLTAEWLQRVVDCHLARNASLGHVMPEMPNCPLVPKGAEAKVSSTGTGFAVAIRANDRASADEILARAQRLVRLSAVSRAQ